METSIKSVLDSLPFVPRKDEVFTYIAFNRETSFYKPVATFRVVGVSYELHGTCLPVSQTWENNSDGGGCQAILLVVPAEGEGKQETIAYLERVINAAFAVSKKNGCEEP